MSFRQLQKNLQAREAGEVRPARQQKEVPFTVSLIGGKQDLAKWRAEQATKEAKWQDSKRVRRQQAIDAFNDAKGGHYHEKAIAAVKTYVPGLGAEPRVEPKRNFIQRVAHTLKRWISSVYKGANFLEY